MKPDRENMERFNDLASQILVRLYEAFPYPVTLAPVEFVGELEEGPNGRLPERGEFCVETIARLREWGVIDGEPFQYGLINATLTRDGFRALDAIPEALGGSTTIGSRLKDAARAASADARGTLIRSAMDELSRLIAGG